MKKGAPIPIPYSFLWKTVNHGKRYSGSLRKGDVSVAEKYYEECLSVPMRSALEKKQEFAIRTVKQFFGE